MSKNKGPILSPQGFKGRFELFFLKMFVPEDRTETSSLHNREAE